MKYSCYLYLPSVSSSSKFLDHLFQWKRKHSLVIFTEDRKGYKELEERVSSFPDIRTNLIETELVSPVRFGESKPSDRYAVRSFLWSLKDARDSNCDYFTVLETDCRVLGDYWDEKIFRGFHEGNSKFCSGQAICGGSLVCWSPASRGFRDFKKLVQFLGEYQNHCPVPVTFEGSCSFAPLRWYPNGALGVYKTSPILEIFSFGIDFTGEELQQYAINVQAWDVHIGTSIPLIYGSQYSQMVAPNAAIYSGCGDHFVKFPERRDLLTSGKVCAIHQVKDENWYP